MQLYRKSSIELQASYTYYSEEFFYQLGLRQFGNFHRVQLEPPPPLRDLIKLAVVADQQFNESGMEINAGVEVSLFFFCQAS
jgi:DNA mismatch repair protein MLH1